MGWSSWSFIRSHPDENKIKAQALAMHNNLQGYGFKYINLDDFWYLDPRTTVDRYGRWVHDPSRFPNGMAALANYVHSLGLKFGMYITPGIPVAAYEQNTPIERTRYHARDIADTSQFETNYNFGGNAMYYIDYRKPGAQEFINSWARLFASWGVDYIKIDGVGTWDIPDIQAWSNALIRTGRPIHLGLSNSLDVGAGETWKTYANSWRISGDVEAYLGPSSYPLTTWANVLSHFQLSSQWTHFAGPGGWNDLDSLEIGNGVYDGTDNGSASNFSQDERQSVMTWWCMAAAPLLLGTDLTNNVDQFDYSLLGNSEVIAVDQAGIPGAPIVDYLNNDPSGTKPEIWRSKQLDGTYALVVANPSGSTQNATADPTVFGVNGGVIVRDLWSKSNLVANPNANPGYKFSGPLSFSLNAHQSKFLKITPLVPVTQYLADAAVNTFTGGTILGSKNTATDGRTAGFIGNGGSVTFNNINVPKTGNYAVTFLYFNGDPSRPATISINQGAPIAVTFPGTGSFSKLGASTQQLALNQGNNSITISAPDSSYAPDVDSIVIPSTTAQYLADAATLVGCTVRSNVTCTDGKCVTQVGMGNTITFKNVTASQTGLHNVTILYLASNARSAEIYGNSGRPVKAEFLPTNSSDSNVVGAVSVNLPLNQGVNSIMIANRNAPAPDIDSIIVAE